MLPLGLYALMPAIALLTICFFVLVTVSKTNSKALQSFGRIIAVSLCILAALSIIASIYSGFTGKRCKPGMRFPFKPQWDHHQMIK